MHLPEQIDCHAHDRYILRDAQNNLFMADF